MDVRRVNTEVRLVGLHLLLFDRMRQLQGSKQTLFKTLTFKTLNPIIFCSLQTLTTKIVLANKAQ